MAQNKKRTIYTRSGEGVSERIVLVLDTNSDAFKELTKTARRERSSIVGVANRFLETYKDTPPSGASAKS